jgi:hypothetical protein
LQGRVVSLPATYCQGIGDFFAESELGRGSP